MHLASADINEIEDFEKQCCLLESENFVQVDWKYERIAKITAVANEENWNTIRTALGVEDKNARIEKEITFYSERALSRKRLGALFVVLLLMIPFVLCTDTNDFD